MLRNALAAWSVALLAACATPPPIPAGEVRAEAAFSADGRLSARRGNDGIAVHYAWRHEPGSDDFDVATPLGQVVARMRGDASGVRVLRPNEPPTDYPDWSALTQAVLGVAIPVDGLAYWIQGAPDGRGSNGIERDAAGRPQVLRQQGWEIVYSYADDASTRPMRLVMRYPDIEPIEVRVVVDNWTAP